MESRKIIRPISELWKNSICQFAKVTRRSLQGNGNLAFADFYAGHLGNTGIKID